jgi:hypothetical protein
LQTGDELGAHAMALVAQDVAGGKSKTGEEMALLAVALGYPAEPPADGDAAFRHYLQGDRAALRQDAYLRETTDTDRYLYLRYLMDQTDDEEAGKFIEEKRLDETALPIAALEMRSRQMGNYAPPTFAMPSIVLAAATSTSMHDARARTPPKELPKAIEAALAATDPDTRVYLRSLLMSALDRAGKYFAVGQGNAQASRSFSEMLAATDSPSMRTFQAYFALREKLLSNDAVPAMTKAAKLSGIGGAPLARLVEEATDYANFGEPRAIRSAREIAGKLDARILDRRVLASMAWRALQDLRTTYRMGMSAIAAAPRDSLTEQVWFAVLRGDAAALQKLASDKTLPPHLRAEAAEKLSNPAESETALRTLLDEDPNDFDATVALEGRLSSQHKTAEAAEVCSRWLSRNDGKTLRAGRLRGSLSFLLYVQGKYQEGLKAAEFALPVGNASAIQGYGLNLAGLGRADEARAAMKLNMQRYAGASSAADAAEVEWVLKDDTGAAQQIAHPPFAITPAEWGGARPIDRCSGIWSPTRSAPATRRSRSG